MKYYLTRILEYTVFYLSKILYKPDGGIPDPFFIISPGRSGSTLLRREIIKRTNCNIPPETGDCIPAAFIKYSQNHFKPWKEKVKAVLSVFEDFHDLKYWSIDVENVRIRLLEYHSKRSFKSIIKELYDEYALQHNFNKDLWGDKTPYLSERINWLTLIFPEAKIIFLSRNKKAIIASRINKLNETPAQARKRYEWSLKAKSRYTDDNADYLEVSYEDLVSHTDAEITKISRFLRAPLLPKPKKNIFLGDDTLEHHKKLKNKISTF